eukprot:TRINITY_DN4861_c0_g1_i2.p2 TRINITY_DN4861_c0_g1~~TRINITY_DN4861_c0_g1_i2.p2  ORF type:complete len:171 (+),score=23.30 TRINITY_DN4861_c0_g1_i2:72-515(+)
MAHRLLAAAGALAPRAVGKGSGGLPLFVRTEAGDLQPFDVPVDAKVSDLVEQYASAHGVHPAALKLLFQGSQLDPSAALADTGVSAEAVIDVETGCTPGGRPAIRPSMSRAVRTSKSTVCAVRFRDTVVCTKSHFKCSATVVCTASA